MSPRALPLVLALGLTLAACPPGTAETPAPTPAATAADRKSVV